MAHKNSVLALNRSLQDLLQSSLDFGGKSVLFAGGLQTDTAYCPQWNESRRCSCEPEVLSLLEFDTCVLPQSPPNVLFGTSFNRILFCLWVKGVFPK